MHRGDVSLQVGCQDLAGSFTLPLVWTCYNAQFILFGAAFIRESLAARFRMMYVHLHSDRGKWTFGPVSPCTCAALPASLDGTYLA